MKQAFAAILIFFLAGCATTECPGIKPVNGGALFRQGVQSGRQEALSLLRDDPRMRLSTSDLSRCDRRASSLPRRGPIKPSTWWKSRGRNLWTLDQCAEKNENKRAKLILMYQTIQEGR